MKRRKRNATTKKKTMKCPKCNATMNLVIQDSEFGDKYYKCSNCSFIVAA